VDGKFSIMSQHVDRAGHSQVAGAGKLVLSRLPAGQGRISADGPSLKLILEGEIRYEFDGRALVVRAGQYLYLDAGSSCLVTNRGTTIGLCIGVPTLPLAARETQDGHDPLLGRSLVLSTKVGRLLQPLGGGAGRHPLRAAAHAPRAGP